MSTVTTQRHNIVLLSFAELGGGQNELREERENVNRRYYQTARGGGLGV